MDAYGIIPTPWARRPHTETPMRYVLLIINPETMVRETRVFDNAKAMEICRELRERGGFQTRLRTIVTR